MFLMIDDGLQDKGTVVGLPGQNVKRSGLLDGGKTRKIVRKLSRKALALLPALPKQKAKLPSMQRMDKRMPSMLSMRSNSVLLETIEAACAVLPLACESTAVQNRAIDSRGIVVVCWYVCVCVVYELYNSNYTYTRSSSALYSIISSQTGFLHSCKLKCTQVFLYCTSMNDVVQSMDSFINLDQNLSEMVVNFGTAEFKNSIIAGNIWNSPYNFGNLLPLHVSLESTSGKYQAVFLRNWTLCLT